MMMQFCGHLKFQENSKVWRFPPRAHQLLAATAGNSNFRSHHSRFAVCVADADEQIGASKGIGKDTFNCIA